MDLSTTYLKLKLRNPLVASASPLSEHVENFKKLEDAGVGAIVMHSLFEEQIAQEEAVLRYGLELGTESFAESLTYFPMIGDYHVGPEQYLQNIEKAKKLVKVPVIGSLNGTSAGGWLKYAENIENAGADAIELNIYHIPTNPSVTSADIEQVCLDIVQLVKSKVKIPVAVKLSPFFSAMVSFAGKLEGAGADGLVLFNRFYQPDIDLQELEVLPKVTLSAPYEMRLPLRWIAILRGNLKVSLAATSGIHDAESVVKMVLIGADATMMCSALLKNGIGHVAEVLKGVESWMKEHDYGSVEEMKGIMSQRSSASSEAFERANYLKTLQSYR
jgi:dihydroorotate dehydrogenase (fumarate)